MFRTFLGESEIDDFDLGIGLRRRKEEILQAQGQEKTSFSRYSHLGFEISMTEIIAMHEIHCRDELSHQLTGFFLGKRRLSANPIEQFAPGEQFHDDIRV